MNGADVLTALRGDPATASIPVVLLTSVDHRIAVRELRSAGATTILTKPTRSSLLLSTILDELRGHGAPAGEALLPAAPVISMEASRPLALAPEAGPGDLDGKLDILVAEDNEVNQFVFTQVLGRLDHTFLVVGDGRRALEAWRERRPTLVLMDVSMPEMNGFEATKAIRAEEAAEGLPRTPIIGVTAHALKGDRERCLDSGMDDYLTKPISPDRMEKKLREWLSAPQALRA
jgi:CheY-like chemotaxis protein